MGKTDISPAERGYKRKLQRERLLELRESFGKDGKRLSQAALAEKLDLPTTTVSTWETQNEKHFRFLHEGDAKSLQKFSGWNYKYFLGLSGWKTEDEYFSKIADDFESDCKRDERLNDIFLTFGYSFRPCDKMVTLRTINGEYDQRPPYRRAFKGASFLGYIKTSELDKLEDKVLDFIKFELQELAQKEKLFVPTLDAYNGYQTKDDPDFMDYDEEERDGE